MTDPTIDYLSDVTELIKIPNTFRKLFGSSDSRSGDAETREAEARRCLVNSIQIRRVSSVSLDLSCDSSSFDSDDCATRAEKVSDLVLPHILGVSPCNYDNVSGGGGLSYILYTCRNYLQMCFDTCKN